MIVIYDENSGFWDHVTPLKRDPQGTQSAVPALVVSPVAKRGHVDHSQYDTTSALKFIELPPHAGAAR